MTEFKVGKTYIRTKIHDEYRGQRQVGICVLKDYPMILLLKECWEGNMATKMDFSLTVRFGTTDKDNAEIWNSPEPT